MVTQSGKGLSTVGTVSIEGRQVTEDMTADDRVGRAVRLLYSSLADQLATHDVYERAYGRHNTLACEARARAAAFRSALYFLHVGDLHEIDGHAESLWRQAMQNKVEVFRGCLNHDLDDDDAFDYLLAGIRERIVACLRAATELLELRS